LPAIDTGARLENVVFLHLRREHGRLLQGEIAYSLTASGREVDFVVGDLFEQRAARLVQACARLADPATPTREVVAPTEAMAETGLSQADIVTLHEEETIDTKDLLATVYQAQRRTADARPPCRAKPRRARLCLGRPITGVTSQRGPADPADASSYVGC
jgi:hypothetical protein